MVLAVTKAFAQAVGQPREALLGKPLDARVTFVSHGDGFDLYVLDGGNEEVSRRDEFLSVATHELKTPIAAMLLRLQRLGRTLTKEQHPCAPEVEAVLSQLGRLMRLIDNVLDVGRLRTGKLSLERGPVDLAELAKDVLDRLSDLARASGSELRLREVQPVRGNWDRERLEQLLTNLVTNAIKYGGGRPVEVSVEAGPGAGRIVVRDRGIGIAAADHERIFHRFERGTEQHGGTSLGLGLYIARELARAHGGDVRVESELGTGSAFTVELPLPQEGT